MGRAKKHRPTLKPAGPWGERIDRLIRANGWPESEWRRHFGVPEKAVRRIRYGRGRASVKFVLALQALENLYRDQLDALDRGEIAARGRLRCCFVDLPQGAAGRPADLQAVGQVTELFDRQKNASPGVPSAPVRR